jgi:anti-sigma-K factor RskA
MTNSPSEGESRLAGHEYFLALSALSTSASLAEDERKRLEDHLVDCETCSSALRDYQRIVRDGMSLATDLGSDFPDVSPISIKSTKRKLFERISHELEGADVKSGLTAKDTRRRALSLSDMGLWNARNLVRCAAGIALVFVLTTGAYRLGERRKSPVNPAIESSAQRAEGSLQEEVAALDRERDTLVSQLRQSEQGLQLLKVQLNQASDKIAQLKQEQQSSEDIALKANEEKISIASERDALNRQLGAAEANVASIQAQLNEVQQLRSGDQARAASLEGRIAELSERQKDNNDTIAQQEQLLTADRDIRDLMGARDLSVAEVYDVDRDGQRQHPFGRVFFTKDKSLIFYAYDLQQQPGITLAKAFQAWGQRGPNTTSAVNLGIFYKDSAADRRWVLKVNDPKTLRQIDAVFVTVEPSGGSATPSGKRLLYAYIRVAPNHP